MGLSGFTGILGTLFGGKNPIDSVADILRGAGVLKDPAQELEARKALQQFQLEILANESKLIESINATMREEAKSDHWMQWSWRPVVGFTFSATILNNYVFLPYFAKIGLQPIVIPGEVWSAMLVILGVAAGTRGWEKIMKAKNGNGK